MIRVGILLNITLSQFEQNVLFFIRKSKRIKIELIIVDNKKSLSPLQKLKKNLKRGRGAYVLIMAIQYFFSKSKHESLSANQYCKMFNYSKLVVDNIYNQDVLNEIKEYNLDLLALLGGFGIIKKPLLNLCPLGILSYHHGDMRKYRGMPPAFWELYNDEDQMGITVQRLSEGLDKGEPILEKTIVISKNEKYSKLTKRAFEDSEPMMRDAILKLESDIFKTSTITKYGKIYTLPNLRQWIRFQFKMLKNKVF